MAMSDTVVDLARPKATPLNSLRPRLTIRFSTAFALLYADLIAVPRYMCTNGTGYYTCDNQRQQCEYDSLRLYHVRRHSAQYERPKTYVRSKRVRLHSAWCQPERGTVWRAIRTKIICVVVT